MKIEKLTPAFKDYLWGGTKLSDVYGKDCDFEIIAESWELSTHAAGESVIAGGEFDGSSDPSSTFVVLSLFYKCRECLSSVL